MYYKLDHIRELVEQARTHAQQEGADFYISFCDLLLDEIQVAVRLFDSMDSLDVR